MKKIIFATGNEDKMKEIRRILADPSLEILSLKDAGIHADIDENGKSFEENAMIKAEAISKMTGEIVLACLLYTSLKLRQRRSHSSTSRFRQSFRA